MAKKPNYNFEKRKKELAKKAKKEEKRLRKLSDTETADETANDETDGEQESDSK